MAASPVENNNSHLFSRAGVGGGYFLKNTEKCVVFRIPIWRSSIIISKMEMIVVFHVDNGENKEALLISNHIYNWHVRRGQRHFATLMPPRGFFSTLREPKFSGLA